MIFLEEEFRAFCPTGEGGGIKNDCSANEGGPRVDNSWKREQEKVLISGKDLKKSPPAKSLAGVKSVTISDGELVSKSLREIGVTLDQAAKACAAIDPQSDVVIAHGGMREIIEYMGSEDPDRYIEDTVTFVSTMPVSGIEGAAKTAASLTRFEDGELVMSYTMLMISDEAKQKASVAVARHMMKGTIASITQAEKIGVTSVEMLAAGDNRDSSDFKGYRIWPRLGFNGVIPRQRITPTWSLARGFFNSYGSGIPDKILSPRARKEKAAGALTIQSLYETKEGQEWWEKNGGEMEMSLNVGDDKDPGWKRFTSLRGRFSKRGLDLADAFFDVEARALLDDDWVEYRNGGCEKVEGGRFAPGNDCASDGGGSSSKADDSWKESNDSVSLSGNDLKEKPPFSGAEKAGRVEIANPKALLEGMSQAGVKSLDDLAAMGGATVRGSEVVFSGAGHPEMGAYLSVENKIPVSRSGDGSEGYFHVGVTVHKEGREHVLGLNEMFPTQEVKATRERVAKATSLMQQAVIESIMAADNSGIARVKMSAAGGPEYDLKGYRLWPQFGFDAPLEPSHKHALAKAPPDVIEKVMRVARPDLFATRIKPSAGALAAALPHSSINVQHLVSFREGDLWWDNNGSTLGMVLDLSDKKSLGYAKFQKRVSQLKKLRERNQERSFFQWLDEEAEFRAGADCGRAEGGRFGAGNDCASDDGGGSSLPADDDDGSLEMDAEAVSASPPFKGAEVLDSFSVNDVHSLKGILSDMGRVKTVENVVAISGGVRQGGSISIDSYGESIIVNSSIPVAPDGSGRLGHIKNMVSLMKDDDGNLVVNYDSMSLDSGAMSSIDGDTEGDSADRRRIVSMVLERMTESLSVAEESGAIRADTIAAGNSGSALQGYRLWPQFGFDGLIDRADIDSIKEDVKLTPEQKRRANSGSMTVQQLIATPEGDRWWNENGSTIELTLDFTDQTTAGYKRFARMKKMLERLKERNKNRSEFVVGVEYRKDDCGRVDGGKFGPKNDCASEDGGGTAVEDKKPRSTKKPGAFREPLKWRPGDSHVDIFREASQNNPTKKSENGKKILSTSIPGAKVVRGLAGKDEIEPLDVGRHLLARQAEHRGRIIDTTKSLSGEDFEYMVSGIVSQVESAVSRGVAPNFYSPEDRKAQVEAYAEVQPLMRGGKTASGFCIGVVGPNGECEPSDGISPQAEFLFRAAQALTSPEANPYENMLRADSVLTAFFEEPDPSKAKLGAGVAMAGAGAQNTLTNFSRLQKIIDRVGLEETRRLFSGPSIAVKDFEKFFLSKVPGSDGERYEANSYAVAEVVPPFSIFGPKVGPFFANNTGDTEALTADIWFTRTWGRLSGELVSQTSADRAKKHGTELMSATGAIGRKELANLGLDGRSFRTLVSRMKQKGEIAQQIVDWAEARDKQYKKDGFPSPKKGTGTEKRYKLDRLAVNILSNQASLMSQPETTVMRSNMIRVMREAAKRTGVSVAYMQDILWQDEQDTWGMLGSRTTTVPGVPSLYSDVIRKIVNEPQNLHDRRRESKRSLGDVEEPMPLPFYGDQKGGFEQAAYDGFMSEISDDEFADLAVEFLRRNAKKESRAFCPTGEGGGVDNSCGSDDGSSAGTSSSSRSPESMPRSFPRGSAKFRDAIDSVSPSPKSIWDRSRGRADTPPEKVITAAADEQGSSGASLTPEAEASYKDLIDEIGRQYEALTAAGLKAKAWKGEGEPYGDPPGSTKPNSDKMREEVAKTGEFSFFMTDKGFGTGAATPDHPMLRETKYKTADGEPMIANDLFRVVHDMVAHVRGGYSFSANGEYNGMLTHASTLPESAWPALFAETFGQNAVYEKTGNYAPQNAYASKVGPEIIKAELAKRNRKVRRAIDAEYESDEPLGYQHRKVRPWLMKGAAESRAYCPTGDGGGIDNSCSASDKGKEPIPAGDKSLKSYEPFTPAESSRNSDFAILPSDEDAISSLKEPQREKYGAHRTLPAGYLLDLRIDIPAFEKHGTYVVTAHEHVNGAGVGAAIGYDSIIRLKGDVDFRVGETAATKIARGKTNKNTHSTVKGKFDPSREIPEDIDDWTPVGYNPKTATYYYDKRNGKEIVGGVDSISVGNSVFVRIPKYGNGRDPSSPPRNAKTDYRSADCGRDESGRFGQDNKCQEEGDGTSDETSGDFRTEADKRETAETFKSDAGDILVVDRRDTSTPDYLDEIEGHGRDLGLGVTFEAARQLQPDSDIETGWGPLEAYTGKAYGYFTGFSSDGSDEIDTYGAEYGAIDDYAADDLKREKKIENEERWKSLDKKEEFGERWDSMTDEERQKEQEDWLWKENELIDEEIDQLREEARSVAAEQMSKDFQKAVARETIECCLQLYRGLSVDAHEAEQMLKWGYVFHDSVNSWTTSRGTARSFGANRLLLVARKPRVGYVYSQNTREEAEVIRPPSKMRITGAVRTKTGMVFYVDEDKDY